MTIYEKLSAVQQALKAPKDLYNEFGKYPYRSAEGILEAVKPLLAKNGLVLYLTDRMIEVGGRVYVEATAEIATVTDGRDDVLSVTAYAREEETKKGMDASQVTGAASSYARKYALNGLFCIDDNKDSDFTNQQTKEKPKAAPKQEDPYAGIKAPDTFFPQCADCGAEIPENVHDYSIRKYGRPLCRNCQSKAR